ncbi:sigma-70 family RNA polymerase sigma factor [Streptomyces sp. NPDC020965]|uniref:sigma-70 family RNA polymerase sigma factor n=1 Tax=Streptomyces sp. NPDC020965 TaxID=3365105 RepID=UPI0037A237AC
MSGDGRDARDDSPGGAGGAEHGAPRSRQVPGQGGPGGSRTGSGFGLGHGVPGPASAGPGAIDPDGSAHTVPNQGTSGTPADDSPVFAASGVEPDGGPEGGFGSGSDTGFGSGFDSGFEAEIHSVPSQRERVRGSDSLLPPSRDPVQSDAELIQRMRDGDDSAYAELFRRHSDAVRRYARSCCRDAHTADDLTAEVFARTLQAVRGGAGPEQAVRAYLLTTVRRTAATWTKSAKREQLIDDFAVFAAEAARGADSGTGETHDLGADVRAMHEAEQSLAMQAFRSLPERWQAVLWHTTVEEESPSEIAPLFGLTANATAVLASRAREGLKQAYLQAHVSSSLTSEGDCARYADRLGAYARGGLRMRAERGLRKHLDECVKCRLAVGELQHVNAGIPALLPVAVIGWFAAGYSVKAAGIVAGGAAGAAGAGAAAAATGGGGSTGAAGGAAASEGLGMPAKAGIAGVLAVAAAAGLVWAFTGDPRPAPEPKAKPPVTQPLAPMKPGPPPAKPEPPAPPTPEEPPPPAPVRAEPPPPKPEPTPVKPEPKPKPTPPEPAPPARTPPPSPTPPPPEPEPTPSPTPERKVYQLNRLEFSVTGDHSGPEVELAESTWLWQRTGLRIGGERYRHGVTVHAKSSITIQLNRSCARYEALVGVDDMTLGLGAVRFSLYGDGTRLWRSEVIRGGDRAVPMAASIAGRKTIRLVVEPHTPFDSVALADWARSRITCG